MTTLLLVGDNAAALEGLTQCVAGLGHTIVTASSLDEARERAVFAKPLVAIVARELAMSSPLAVTTLPLAPRGALVLYAGLDEERPALPSGLRRTVLADLAMPLERHRLTALVTTVCARARAAGSSGEATPPHGEPRITPS